jgi:hypothetical protein
MIMKKINDRLYEFFELDPEDDNREITDVEYTEVKDEVDYSKYEYYFGEDFCLLLEDSNKDSKSLVLSEYKIMGSDLIDHEDVEVITKPKSKKDELIDSLNYLKSKPFKTKQDRESIYTLEIVLNNIR